MASRYWQGLESFYYRVAVFLLAPLSAILAFKFIWQQEGKRTKGTAAGNQAGPEKIEDNMVQAAPVAHL